MPQQTRTVLWMKFIKPLITVVAAVATIAAFVASFKLGVAVLLAVLVLARLVRGPSSDSGGVIGVDQQSQAHGRPKDEGNGGVGRQTFSSPYHGRP